MAFKSNFKKKLFLLKPKDNFRNAHERNTCLFNMFLFLIQRIIHSVNG